MTPETENPHEAKSFYLGSLRGMFMLIRVDTLRKVHRVGFIAAWLKRKKWLPFLAAQG